MQHPESVRNRVASLAVLAAVVLVHFGASQDAPEAKPAPQMQSAADCGQALKGAEEIFRPDMFLVVGEIHGTREIPLYFGELVCQAAHKGFTIRVALELPEMQQPTVDEVFKTPDEKKAREILLASSFFSREYQDGRGSTAMAELVLRLRALQKSGRDLRVLCFDPVAPGKRDRRMAQRIAAARKKEPKSAFFVLTGSLHARKEQFSNFKFSPMAAHLVESGLSPLCLKAVTAGGSAWVCPAGEPCGVLKIGGKDLGAKPFVDPKKDDVGGGYDGILYVGKASASEPTH